MDFTREARPDGRATTSSPGRIVPEATVPAKPRKSRCGRSTVCTGKRKSTKLRSAATCTFSSVCSSVCPWYQGMRSLRRVTLSPSSALSGMNVMSWMSSFCENSWYSRTMAS